MQENIEKSKDKAKAITNKATRKQMLAKLKREFEKMEKQIAEE